MEAVTDAAKVLIIVPAFNEERSLPGVLASIREKAPGYDVLVVNDGSSDGTSRVAHAGCAEVLDLPINLGIGGAVQAGFKYALRHGYEAAVQVDADGQHLAEEIPKLVGPVVEGRCDVVIGSRFLEPTAYRGSPRRRLVIAFLSWLCGRLAGERITDATSGFRAFGAAALAYVADNYAVDYPEPKSIPALSRRGLRIAEISVEMKQRESGVSSLGGLKALHYVINVTLSLLVDAIRKPTEAESGG